MIEQNFTLKCSKGHQIVPFRGLPKHYPASAEIQCEKCEIRDMKKFRVYWRCLDKCDQDYCNQCMYDLMPSNKGEIIQAPNVMA
jgi:hypothetical protein